MNARVVFLAVLALTSCAPRGLPLTAGGQCRVGPDGGPLAERGIGGTGSPTTQLAERGIGGTGGKVGIVGVITGFASICVDNLEVAYPGNVVVRIDGAPAAAAALRVGQVAAIPARSGDGLKTDEVAVFHEVSGPIEQSGTSTLVVVGQRVQRDGAPPLALAVGDWVSVSGLRTADGSIAATRFDRRPAGRVLLRGRLTGHAGQLILAGVPLASDQADLSHLVGHAAVAEGHYERGVLYADSVNLDPLANDPTAYFGDSTNRFVIESYTALSRDGVLLGDIPFASDIASAGGDHVPVRSIVDLARRPDGSVTATALERGQGDRFAPSNGSATPINMLPSGASPAIPAPVPSQAPAFDHTPSRAGSVPPSSQPPHGGGPAGAELGRSLGAPTPPDQSNVPGPPHH